MQARKAPARPRGSVTMTEDRRGFFFIVSFSFDFLFLSDIVLSFPNLLVLYFPDIGYLHFIILQKGMNVNKSLLIFDNFRNGCRDVFGK